MKHIGIALFFGILSLFAFRFVAGTLEDVGATIDEVKSQTVYRLAQDHFSPYYTTQIKEACKKLPPGVREATLFSIGKVIRDYVESPEFKTDYEKFLNELYHGSSFDENDPQWEAHRKQKFEELNNFISSANPAMIDMFVSTLDVDVQGKQAMLTMLNNPAMKELAAQMPNTAGDMTKDIEEDGMLKNLFKSNPAEFKKKYPELMAARQMRDEIGQAKKNAESSNKKATEEKEKRIDYRARLKSQLQEFLDATADVDFNAATKANADGIKQFVNPAYEEKNGDWKFYYRCGKEAITGARKYAQGWLASLN